MSESFVTVTQSAGIARVTLNRPERLNALTEPLLQQLCAHLDALAADPGTRVVVLTGAGRGFCAGQDLADRDPRRHAHPFDLEEIQRRLFHPVILGLREMPKPVIAMVNGIASGAGVGLALACDLVVAAEGASFALSFVKLGLSADAGVARALSAALGPARARAALMLGETITAPRAAELGLIHTCVPDTELEARTAKIAEQLACGPQSALAAIKHAVAAAQALPDPREALAAEAHAQGVAGRDPDYPEAVLAFLERRPVRFR